MTNENVPSWIPNPEVLKTANITALMRDRNLSSYPELHAWSIQHRAEFWERMIQRVGIRFRQPYQKIVDLVGGVEAAQWLPGAVLNIVESCFQANPNAVAIAYQSPGEAIQIWTYAELERWTNRVANGLVDAGFQPGEAIAVILPMTAEAVAIYLGIIKAGCVVVGIADSFAAEAIATRLRITHAKAVFTQDVILRGGKRLPLYEKVAEAGAAGAIVLSAEADGQLNLREGDPLRVSRRDRTWKDFLSDQESFDAVPLAANAHSNILFSSGTTGEPKAIPWTHTTPIKCAVDAHLHHDIHPGDVLAWPTSLGWMMGPWLIYASLINRGTIALYYGSPGDRGFGEFVQNAGVTMLGVVPSLVSSWKASDCMRELDWSRIKVFSSTGECSNARDMQFLMKLAGNRPVIEYCGGTEIGGAYITGTVVQPAIPATFTTPALGLDLVILDETDHPATKGEAFIIPPSIGLSTELLNRDHHQVYFAETPQISGISTPLRRHGDQLERLPNGYFRAHGRADDTMNLGGIKVSAVEVEQALNTVEEVAEVAAIAHSPTDGGPSQLIVFAVPLANTQPSPEALQQAFQQALRQRLNPLFKVQQVVLLESLPRTASNKLMRRVLRDRYLDHTQA